VYWVISSGKYLSGLVRNNYDHLKQSCCYVPPASGPTWNYCKKASTAEVVIIWQ
jgi:hypothetical protein